MLSRDSVNDNFSDNISGNRRAKFYESLQKMKSGAVKERHGKRRATLIDAGKSYEGFYLHTRQSRQETLRAISEQQLPSRSISIDLWLKDVVHGEHSTFLFPANAGGPDLMFVLQNDEQQLVLFVIQVKPSKAISTSNNC
jgi:hypothetical protein